MKAQRLIDAIGHLDSEDQVYVQVNGTRVQLSHVEIDEYHIVLVGETMKLRAVS